jgi:hypothetical protein
MRQKGSFEFAARSIHQGDTARQSLNRRKNGYHHEAHEEHEGKYFFKIRCPLRYPIFVSFATFVVRMSFVKCQERLCLVENVRGGTASTAER